ncbi:MAG: uroporphyrinogen-III C-methyltransferase, partial [Pseudomonadota bacterium]
PRIAKLLSPGQPRRQFWERFLDGAVANRLQAGKSVTEDSLEREVQRVIQSTAEIRGEAWLVGAGPGNPDLLTLRALQLMQQADVVLYDSLVSEQVLARVRRDATRICVGKRAGRPSMAQEAINRLLVNKVRQGHKVLRLKGGDPFVFGRGGEEMQALQVNDLPYEVVPGITAAVACAAAAGIPLTHRDFAQSLSIVTGRLKRGEPQSSWKAWSGPSQTLAIYMGLGDRERIARELITAGRAAETPVAIVSNGTLATQQTTVGTLDELRSGTLSVPAATPAMLYVGEVCRFADARRTDVPAANDTNDATNATLATVYSTSSPN